MIELEERVVHELRALLADANTSLPRKYRALFALRNVQGDAARSALAAGACIVLNKCVVVSSIAAST